MEATQQGRMNSGPQNCTSSVSPEHYQSEHGAPRGWALRGSIMWNSHSLAAVMETGRQLTGSEAEDMRILWGDGKASGYIHNMLIKTHWCYT